MNQEIKTDQAPQPIGPYSQAIRAGNTIFVAGQCPFDPKTGAVVGATIEEQTERALENMKAVLTAAGAGLEHVVKTTVHLSDLANFKAFNQVYNGYFTQPYPARTTVGSQLPGVLVEIDCIAVI